MSTMLGSMQRHIVARSSAQAAQLPLMPSSYVPRVAPCCARRLQNSYVASHVLRPQRLLPAQAAASDAVMDDPFAAEAEQTLEASTPPAESTTFEALGVAQLLLVSCCTSLALPGLSILEKSCGPGWRRKSTQVYANCVSLQDGLASMNVAGPSPIQAAAIPVFLEGKNVAIQSFTGSGKTLAYLLPALTLALARGQEMLKAGNHNVPVQVSVPCHGNIDVRGPG